MLRQLSTARELCPDCLGYPCPRILVETLTTLLGTNSSIDMLVADKRKSSDHQVTCYVVNTCQVRNAGNHGPSYGYVLKL
eukprot:scaffold16266_cov44-Prasinocladus_malaysianus.AAC.1